MADNLCNLPDLYRVRPTQRALKESQVGELFQTEEEKLWVISQLKLLRHWPPTLDKQQELGFDLDIEKIQAVGEEFYEYRLGSNKLSHGGNLRVFFWVHEPSKTIWIIHAYWKKTQRIVDPVKQLVARRIRNLKGHIQDGTIT